MKCDEFLGNLDAFVDGELDSAARTDLLEHARICDDCNKELRSAEMLRDVLRDADAGVTVPLQAQAMWRGAIRAEDRKRRTRSFYRKMGAVAAAFAVLVGFAAGYQLLNEKPKEVTGAYIEADGDESFSTYAFIAPDGGDEMNTPMAVARVADTTEANASVRIAADDVSEAAETVVSLVSEFNGHVGTSSVNAGTAYITAYIPVGEMGAFTESLAYAGTVDSSRMSGDAADMVCVTITIQ